MDRKFTPTTLLIWSGLLIWAADFLFVYVFAALACARGFAGLQVLGFAIVPFATVLASVAALAATTIMLMRSLRRAREASSEERVQFVLFLTAALCALGGVAIVWSALPPLLLRTGCA